LSFFDEDDEPTRTTRTRTRPSPPPRRGRVASGGSNTAQTVLIRRMVAVILGAALLVVLFAVVSACNDRRHENALRDYNRRVSNLAVESRNTGREFFRQMEGANSQAPQDLYQQIISFKNTADQSLTQARDLPVPEDMAEAQRSLLISLELRRDGLTKIAEDVKTALGDEGEAADRAIGGIAGQMQSFTASDVLYRTRVVEFIKKGLADAKVGDQTIEESRFMDDIDWQSPQFVAARLGQQLSSGDGDGGGGGDDQTSGPGLHGTGLDATSYGQVTLQPGAANRLVFAAGQPFTVSFTNQGENDEFNIKVSVKIARESGEPITLNKTVPKVAQGEKATVTLPLNREPPLDTAVTITTTVASVPGEKTKDNNTSEYPSVFVAG
jgi:hypothetical protein